MTDSTFLSASPSQQRVGIAILRIVTGAVFVMHGGQKVFMLGLTAITEGFGKMGLPMPGILAPFISYLELCGGLALILGLLTRLVALGLAFDMLGAILFVHLANGFFNPTGYEFPLTLLAAMLALVLAGPGALSVDGVLAARRRALSP